LDNIEDGIWPGWKGPNWDHISKDAKDLIRGMMEPDSGKRLTLNQCLESAWITNNQPDVELGGIQGSIRDYQAKKRLKGAIRGIMATNKLSAMVALAGAAKKGNVAPVAQAPVAKKVVTATWTTLRVTILAGKNLAPKDPNGKSDPYVTVWCGAAKPLKTKVKKATLNPEWKEDNVFEISATLSVGKTLDIEVWDHDLVPPDEFMGRISLPVDSIAPEVKDFYKLAKDEHKYRKEKVSGELLLQIQKI